MNTTKRFRLRPWLLVITPLLILYTALQSAPAQAFEDEEVPIATEIPSEGFWPTERMLARMLDRISDEVGSHYDMDEEQADLTRDLMGETIIGWMNDNRAEIQTLTNQFLESTLHDEPPEIDDVAVWSKRVMRMMDSFDTDVMTNLTDGMREYMTEDQELMLDAEYAAYETARGLMNNKLGVWADGGYDPESEWMPPGPERRRAEREADRERRAQIDAAREEVLAQGNPQGLETAERTDAKPSPKEPKRPKDEWEKYTERYMARYEFDDAQKQKAMSYLRTAQESRDNYLRTRSDRIDAVQDQLKAATTEESRQKALDEYAKLNAPVERRFQQLKEKLSGIPTRAQRKAAAEKEAEADKKAEGNRD